MHIVFLSDNFPPEVNASASRVYERACYWVKWGHQVTILTCAPNFPDGKVYSGYKNKWRQVEWMDGIKVIRVKTFITANKGFTLRILDFLSYMFMAVINGIGIKKPDVIISTSPQFFAAVGGWMLGKLKRKPFIFELGDLWPESIKAVGAMRPSLALRMLEKLELFLYRQASQVIALTESFKTNLVERGIDANKIQVIINGVDLQRYAPQAKDPALIAQYQLEGKFVIGYIGTMGMAHGLSNVIDAAKLCPNITFLFVGAGAESESLQIQADGLSNVLFIPRQSKADIPKYWSLCDLALIHLKDNPTFAGVIPSKLFEIMGMGLPIVCAAPKGEATDIVEQTKAGVTVASNNPELLANAIVILAAEPAQLTLFAQNSYAARTQYSREHQAQSIINAINSPDILIAKKN